MQDGKKVRRRIIAVIVSRGGSVASGENANFLGWFYRQIDLHSYAHDRVTELGNILVAMEADEQVMLIRNSRGGISGASKTPTTDLEGIEKEQGVFETPEEVWNLVAILRSRIVEQQIRFEQSDAAVALAMAEEAEIDRQSKEDELRDANERIVDLEQEIERLRAEVEASGDVSLLEEEIRCLRTRLESRAASHESTREEFRRYREEMQERLSQKGNEISKLKRQLEQARMFPVDELASAIRMAGDMGIILELPGPSA